MAPHGEPSTNPFAGLSAGRVRSARTVPEMRTPANPAGCATRAGTRSLIRTVPRPRRALLAAAVRVQDGARPPGGGDKSPSLAHRDAAFRAVSRIWAREVPLLAPSPRRCRESSTSRRCRDDRHTGCRPSRLALRLEGDLPSASAAPLVSAARSDATERRARRQTWLPQSTGAHTRSDLSRGFRLDSWQPRTD